MATNGFFPHAAARPAVADVAAVPDEVWRAIRDAARGRHADPVRLTEPWAPLFGPLAAPVPTDRSFVVGQLGQSLDGRIATPTGHSHYINGRAALIHLHRLRALVDAVVVGIGTAVADDPLLTVRHVDGASPARVVIDPSGRLPRSAKLLARDDVPRFVVTREDARVDAVDGTEILRLPAGAGGRLEPAGVLAMLRARGLARVLVEGGTHTLSGFLAAGCLDRLHVMVAPLIVGSGPTGIALPPIDRLDGALRPATGIYRLGDDLLFDCDLRA